uniref:uncharacterized protein LOC124055348 isoform X1 n=1 Tax=Scatophagus argus TaxID=75038 RepID=UPI001ED81E3C|nr:uncharacterized protein LOC124055348 isoform X1 [Scatophagus argus]
MTWALTHRTRPVTGVATGTMHPEEKVALEETIIREEILTMRMTAMEGAAAGMIRRTATGDAALTGTVLGTIRRTATGDAALTGTVLGTIRRTATGDAALTGTVLVIIRRTATGDAALTVIRTATGMDTAPVAMEIVNMIVTTALVVVVEALVESTAVGAAGAVGVAAKKMTGTAAVVKSMATGTSTAMAMDTVVDVDVDTDEETGRAANTGRSHAGVL